jgi:hypothetical protein
LQDAAMLAMGITDGDQNALAHRPRIRVRGRRRAAPGCSRRPFGERLGRLLA